MINCIKKVYNKLFNPLPKIEKGLFPVSITFYKNKNESTESRLIYLFELEYADSTDTNKFPQQKTMVGEIEYFVLCRQPFIDLFSRFFATEELVLKDFIKEQFMLKKFKGEL